MTNSTNKHNGISLTLDTVRKNSMNITSWTTKYVHNSL